MVFLPLPRRHNMYDGSEEFWIVTKESGKRQESHSYEETHEQKKQAGCLVIHSPIFLSCACAIYTCSYISNTCMCLIRLMRLLFLPAYCCLLKSPNVFWQPRQPPSPIVSSVTSSKVWRPWETELLLKRIRLTAWALPRKTSTARRGVIHRTLHFLNIYIYVNLLWYLRIYEVNALSELFCRSILWWIVPARRKTASRSSWKV